MKIIAVGMNYALHNKELGHTHENKEPVIFLKPDSAILKDGKPFFIPDFSNEVHYETEVVVRICRLGKNIAPRFAHRYYDAVTVGIDFTARDLQRKFREAGNPWELCKGFDNSAAIGTFVPLEQAGGDLQQLDFRLEQVQDFPPTPMTVSTEAWYTGFHPYTLEPVFSAKTQREKLAQRQFFFWYKPEERKNILNELRRIGRQDLIDKLYGKRNK